MEQAALPCMGLGDNTHVMVSSPASLPSPQKNQMAYCKSSPMSCPATPMSCPVTPTVMNTDSVPETMLATSSSMYPDCYMPYTFHGAESGNGYFKAAQVTPVSTQSMYSIPASHGGLSSLSVKNCSNQLAFGTNPQTTSLSTDLTNPLPVMKRSQIGPYQAINPNFIQTEDTTSGQFLCKQEVGVPVNTFQGNTFHNQAAGSQSFNKNHLPASLHRRNVAHCLSSRRSRISPSSGSSTYSSSGDEISGLRADPGGGVGKSSGHAWKRKRELSTSGSFTQLPLRKWRPHSDSGFNSFSSGSSGNDSEVGTPSATSYTQWTDKLTQPGFKPLPLPDPDSLPLPFEPVPPQDMMGMSAGYIPPLAENPDQMFSTLQPGMDAKTRMKTLYHRKTHLPSSSISKPHETKERRFKRTAEALQQSGLWEVASRTGTLMKQNQKLQTDLDTFKADSLNFLKSVLKNTQNRDFIKQVISNALGSSSGSSNSSLISSVMSGALKLGLYGKTSENDAASLQPVENITVPKTEIPLSPESLRVPLPSDVINAMSDDVKVTLSNGLTIPLLDKTAVSTHLDSCTDIPIDVTLNNLQNDVDILDVTDVLPTLPPLLDEAVALPVEITASIPPDIAVSVPLDVKCEFNLCSDVGMAVSDESTPVVLPHSPHDIFEIT